MEDAIVAYEAAAAAAPGTASASSALRKRAALLEARGTALERPRCVAQDLGYFEGVEHLRLYGSPHSSLGLVGRRLR